ncbi:MAG: bifunctional DNA-formamidopyrimidine glycosylase/DNA-(apurinic or apyrimidinic site) lyase [Candidatus Omnitrophica bacterium]|nr:bifunctional DNA-formamidopyrimidine glycosylase/DNA-(apurinic or apyrimidinic site) lyase [Candidatus Omnitrophota bacterium]MDD5351639.1 bifunctional DNA-formamidopyrimidine glycosylase/DNA-(apurinic or apyrimidinic site) lyase [Candidatus Omnitrophota bacterium]MDD5550849.1 bifunctional DNA-formamidopyrimidine glycosylase/DNA-(apurinic or apyrimidinic site) lyase [Candidatus Omnitrophota bacterium]
MPELPEVETIKRQLEKSIKGKIITGVIVNNAKVIKEPSLDLFKKRIKGAKIENILRKGKALIFELSSGKSLVVHLRMTGQLVYPGNGKKSRISFKLSDNRFLDYNDRRILGELRLLDDWRNLKFIRELGPEPYDLTEEEFSIMLSQKKTKIKPLLMDQTFISGIGNLYAAEALFKARINPQRHASSLSEKESKKLFISIKEILDAATKHRGSSVDQYVTASGEKGDYARFHKVYDRLGEPCYVCKSPIKRVSLGGRGTYFCARCQK